MMESIYTSLQNDIYRIRGLIPEAALYEQLAEECAELSQACLKKSRKLRNENYTPKTMEEIDNGLKEEFTDVCLAAWACGIETDLALSYAKAERWIDRTTNQVIESNDPKN